MLIQPHQLPQALADTRHHLFLIAGDEPLQRVECLDTIRKFARSKGADERTAFLAERQFNWQQVTMFYQNVSLFSMLRILEINLPTGKPGAEGQIALLDIAQQPSNDTITLLILPKLDREIRQSSWYSAWQQHGLVIEIQDIPIQALPHWIGQRLQLQQQSTDEASLAFIAHQVEGNLLAAHQEIQKLGLLYPEGKLSAEAIRDAVLNVARYDAFQLGEAVLHGDTPRTLRILKGLQEEGEQPVTVMNPLIWLFRPLLALKLAQSRGENMQQAFNTARLFGERQAIVKQGLARLSLKQIEAAHQKLTEIDRIAKGVMPGDAWLEISRLCFGLARIPSKSR